MAQHIFSAHARFMQEALGPSAIEKPLLAGGVTSLDVFNITQSQRFGCDICNVALQRNEAYRKLPARQ